MDKQTSILSNTTSSRIPVNTRTIGTPEGIYILYLEDYVHTFMKKVLADKNSETISLGTGDEYQVEKNPKSNIALYGNCIEENGRYRLVISGAAVLDNKDKVRQYNDTYFPSCTYIGMAGISRNKDSKLRLELTLSNTTVILDDFYIYYDQNAEMQNYLVEWNAEKEKGAEKEQASAAEQGTRVRNRVDDAAHLGRIAQAYNREEAKVSFMWNVMNILCLGFVVCIMAYGITAVNNYNKMQNMQEKIDYCMAFIEENTSFRFNEADDAQTASAMKQNIQTAGADTNPEISNPDTTETQTMNPQAANPEPVSSTAANATAEDTANSASNKAADSTTAETEAAAGSEAVNSTAAEGTANAAANGDTAADSTAGTPETADAAANNETANTAAANTGESNTAQQPEQQDTQSSQQQAVEAASGDVQASVQPEQPMQYYIVRKGDTLRTICYDIYGDYSHVDEICEWNQIEDPDSILYGQKLLLP